MFDNVGNKLKSIASIFAFLGIAASVILGLIVLFGSSVILGLLIMVFGSFLSWVSNLVIYGIGEAVENSQIAAQYAIRAKKESEGSEQANQPQTFYTASAPVQKQSNSYGQVNQPQTFRTAPASGQWKCPACGRTNQGYVSTCACGRDR